jgi:hypothetical protein
LALVDICLSLTDKSQLPDCRTDGIIRDPSRPPASAGVAKPHGGSRIVRRIASVDSPSSSIGMFVRTCAAGSNHLPFGRAVVGVRSRASRAERRRPLARQNPRAQPSAACSGGRRKDLKQTVPSLRPKPNNRRPQRPRQNGGRRGRPPIRRRRKSMGGGTRTLAAPRLKAASHST